MTLRYGAVLQAVASLRGPVADEIAPTHRDVAYRAHALRGIPPHADVYVPAQPTGASVILVHGGAFVIGSRRMKPARLLASRLCAAGIAVCAIDYRMIFRGGRLTEAVADVRAAVAFWHAHAPTLGLAPDAVTLVGSSAGATLAYLAASAEPGRIARLACCFGLYELEHLRGPLATLLPRLLFRTGDRAAWHARSPAGEAPPAAPTLLLHGDDDGLVPVDQARRLAARRDALGLPTRLVIYPGAPHGFFGQPGPVADAGVQELIAHMSAPG